MTDEQYIEHLEDTILRLRRKIVSLEQKYSDFMWEKYPDTSGGAFTQDEINNSHDSRLGFY